MLVCAVLVLAGMGQATAGDYNDVEVGTSARTKLEERFKVGLVQVTIDTKPSTLPARRAGDRMVSRLRVSVGGRPIDVPLSAYLDLYSVNRARLREEGKSVVLSMDCADGAESYEARIFITSRRINRRALYTLDSPAQLLEETVYKLVVL